MDISIKKLFQDIGLEEAASLEDDFDDDDDDLQDEDTMPENGTFERVDGMNRIRGTHKIGTIRVPYQTLVDTFGKPSPGDNYRTFCEWALSIVDRDVDEKEPVIITIYDWKQFDPDQQVTLDDVSKVNEWNVGGHRPYSMSALRKILKV
jgi:hypothetical protein